MDRHGGELALGLLVTTRAIARAVGLEHCDAGQLAAGVVGGECMTAHAVRARTFAQALLRGTRGMFDASLGCVAQRTATWRNRAHRAFVEFVTAVARDVLLHDVQRVAGHAAVRAPLLLNVHTAPRRSRRALVRARRRARDDPGEQQPAEQEERPKPIRAVQVPTDSRTHRVAKRCLCRCRSGLSGRANLARERWISWLTTLGFRSNVVENTG